MKQRGIQLIDNEALMAMSSVVGAIRQALVRKGVLTDDEIDKDIRATIAMIPCDAETKRSVLFLALGPGADIEIVDK